MEREPEKLERREMWETESWRENKEINKILYNLATVHSKKMRVQCSKIVNLIAYNGVGFLSFNAKK